MIDKFSWLHLSDFHFRGSGDTFSQDVSCEAVRRDIPRRISTEYPLEFIVTTGDIAFSGKRHEYDLALTFFDALLGELGVDRSRLFIVPGNHDVDRAKHRYTYDGVRGGLTNQQAVDTFLGQETELNLVMERQSEFRDFKYGLLRIEDIETTKDRLASVRLLDLDGFRISVLELNSAWLSGEKDEAGNLLIGERQIINALGLVDSHRPHLAIALTHHPPDWLAEFDKLSCLSRLVPRLNIFHSGHLHWHQAHVLLAPGGAQCLHSAAGSTHETRHYRNAYNLVEFDVGSSLAIIRQFEFDPAAGEFLERPSIEYPIRSTREFSVTALEVACALRDAVPETKQFADYMAALLLENLEEVPVSLPSSGTILASKQLGADLQFPEVQEFLRISNLIRVYDEVSLGDLFSNHQFTISRFAHLLSRTTSTDDKFADMLADRGTLAQTIAGLKSSDHPPYQVQHLDDLAQTGTLPEVIAAATRYQASAYREVQISARRHLSVALLRSRDTDQRQDGLRIAFRNLNESWAAAIDYCVAAAAAESFQDYERAEQTALAALDYWPSDIPLREYCRSLITQTGSQTLRRRLEDAGVD